MDELIELLAEDSHKGWAEEKIRQGWADHVFPKAARNRSYHGDCPVHESRHHADMLPYAELPENVREYDRVTVRGVLAGIERHGYRVTKAD